MREGGRYCERANGERAIEGKRGGDKENRRGRAEREKGGRGREKEREKWQKTRNRESLSKKNDRGKPYEKVR